jgi:hypothetical protein
MASTDPHRWCTGCGAVTRVGDGFCGACGQAQPTGWSPPVRPGGKATWMPPARAPAPLTPWGRAGGPPPGPGPAVPLGEMDTLSAAALRRLSGAVPGASPDPPSPRPDPAPSGRRSPGVVVAAIAASVAVVAGAAALSVELSSRGGGTPTALRPAVASVPPSGHGHSPVAARGPSGASSGQSGTDQGGGVPANPSGGSQPDATGSSGSWDEYTDPATGFQISYPADWTVSTESDGTFFRDPSTDAFMLVAHQSPAGPSALGAWQQQEPVFASQHEGYQRVSLVGDDQQATWEYTYDDNGTIMHGIDAAQVVDNGQYGFALNWVTDQSDWSTLQPTFTHMQSTFVSPGG